MATHISDEYPNRLEVASSQGQPPLVINRHRDETITFDPLFAGIHLTKTDTTALAKFIVNAYVDPSDEGESVDLTKGGE